MVKCVRASRSDAEKVRSKLLADGLLSRDHRLCPDGPDVLIPVLSTPDDMRTEEHELEAIDRKETDYRNLVDTEQKDRLPSSFDVVGDVAIVKIPEDLAHLKNNIGEAIFKTVGVRLVMMDSGVKGELRIRELERIAGSGDTETIHKEFGVRMLTDPSKVYFNPRLATERMRIASLVKDNETVIDMFAGVAPFPLMISKHTGAKEIYAIDLNEDAERFMKENIRMNKANNIIALQGDARAVMKDLPKADRVIMNLPQSAVDFLDTALNAVKVGGMVHLHTILEKDVDPETILGDVRKKGFVVELKSVNELKTYSPSSSVYVLDIVRCN